MCCSAHTPVLTVCAAKAVGDEATERGLLQLKVPLPCEEARHYSFASFRRGSTVCLSE